MNDFDALLKRSFAEASEPADDGFSAAITARVARAEKAAKVRNAVQTGGVIVALAAVAYGLSGLAGSLVPELVASAGLELARAHGAVSGSSVNAGGLVQALGAGLSQVLLVAAALAGGAVAFRTAQE
jgi:hypothetical protein